MHRHSGLSTSQICDRSGGGSSAARSDKSRDQFQSLSGILERGLGFGLEPNAAAALDAEDRRRCGQPCEGGDGIVEDYDRLLLGARPDVCVAGDVVDRTGAVWASVVRLYAEVSLIHACFGLEGFLASKVYVEFLTGDFRVWIQPDEFVVNILFGLECWCCVNLDSSLLSTSVVAWAEQLRFGPLEAEEDSDRIHDDRSNKEIEKNNNGDCTEARFPWS